MNNADAMLRKVASKPFGHEELCCSALIDYGLGLGLPDHLPIRDRDTDEPLGEMDISTIFGQICVPEDNVFEQLGDKWIFARSIFRHTRACYVGDWWPALVYLRLKTLIKEISNTYTGLDVTEHLELAKALGLKQLLGKPYHPDADAPVPCTVGMTLAEFLKACTSPHRFFETCFVLYDQGDAIKYELRFDNLPGVAKAIAEALDQRLKNLEVIIPPA